MFRRHRKSPVQRALSTSSTSSAFSSSSSSLLADGGPSHQAAAAHILSEHMNVSLPPVSRKRYEVFLVFMLVAAGMLSYWVWQSRHAGDRSLSDPLSYLPTDVSTVLLITYHRPQATAENVKMATTLHETALFNLWTKLLPKTSHYLLDSEELGAFMIGFVSGLCFRAPESIPSFVLATLADVNNMISPKHIPLYLHLIHQGVWRCESDACTLQHAKLAKRFRLDDEEQRHNQKQTQQQAAQHKTDDKQQSDGDEVVKNDMKAWSELYSKVPPTLLKRRPSIPIIWELWGRFFATGSVEYVSRVCDVADVDVSNEAWLLPSHLQHLNGSASSPSHVSPSSFEYMSHGDLVTYKAAHHTLLQFANRRIDSQLAATFVNASEGPPHHNFMHPLIRTYLQRRAQLSDTTRSFKLLVDHILPY